MAQCEFPDDEGWVSDESSFYGDENVREFFESRACSTLKHPSELSALLPSKKQVKHESPVSALSSSTASGGQSGHAHDVLDFLRSRPPNRPVAKLPSPLRSADGPGSAYVNVPDRRLGHDNAWQRDEAVEDFLLRKPPGDPLTHAEDGWLWIESPKQPRAQVEARKVFDLQTFKQQADTLLRGFEAKQVATELEHAGKAPGTIARKMAPLRDQLETGLLGLAMKTGVTCGKWMLFPDINDLHRYWRAVATGTVEGRLGPMSKTAIRDPNEPETVICIYTYDFSDSKDLRRVLHELVNLDLCSPHRKAIYYKIDAYTSLGIKSKNDYKLRASLCSSNEILKEGKVSSAGPIAKLDEHPNFCSVLGGDL